MSDIVEGSDGLLYISEPSGHRIRRIDPATGVVSTLAGTGVAGHVDGVATPP